MASDFQPGGVLGLNADVAGTANVPPAEERHQQDSVRPGPGPEQVLSREGEDKAAVVPGEGSAGGLWSGSTAPHRHHCLMLPHQGRVPSALGSAPWGFTFIHNKAHVRGLNPVFKHIFLSVTLKMSPRVPRKPE